MRRFIALTVIKYEDLATGLIGQSNCFSKCLKNYAPPEFIIPQGSQVLSKQLKASQNENYREYGAHGMDLSVMLPVNERRYNCMSYCVFNKLTTIDSLGRVCTATECLSQVDCGGGVGGGSYPLQHYGKVVVLTQFWGEGYFHFIMENLPRLFPVLDMVISDPHIKIHIPTGDGPFIPYLLESLGIERHRLVSGNVKAEAVVYPETVQCGSPKLVQLSALRSMFQFVGIRGICPQIAFTKKFILVVTREGANSRTLVNQRELLDALRRNTPEADVEVRVFRPQSPDKCSHHRDMQIFKNSLVVVAPHGAGLSNIILANPGMVVIEIQTKTINMCYMDISLRLGFRHFVIVDEKATHSTSLVADIPQILNIVTRYI